MHMWIQLYVLTCEYQLYSLLNFNSKIYVLASCSIKKLHVLGCPVLYYPAAVAFSSHYWFVTMQNLDGKLGWHIYFLESFVLFTTVIWINSVSRKRRWETSFFISDAILVRTTCHASYLLTVCKPYYSSLLVSLLICEHGKSRWQTRMTHLLPLFTKSEAFVLSRWEGKCFAHLLQKACFSTDACHWQCMIVSYSQYSVIKLFSFSPQCHYSTDLLQHSFKPSALPANVSLKCRIHGLLQLLN